MKFSILTLFPEMVYNTINTSITARGIQNGKLNIQTVNIRDFSVDKNKRVDDYSYGGGAGMIIEPECVYRAYESVACGKRKRVVYMTPKGKTFNMQMAKEFAKEEELVILCGHYEGIDERVLEEIVTDYVSIGDYVLTGGELAACVIVDATSRFCEGVLGNDESATVESFYGDLLEYPQYTRPKSWHGKEVPEVLLSGNKIEIDRYRLQKSEEITKKIRPDLYEKYQNRQLIIKRLEKKKKDNIHVIELLKRNMGVVLHDEDDCLIAVSESMKIAFVYCDSNNDLNKILQVIPSDIECIYTSNQDFAEYANDNGFCNLNKSVQFIYTEKVTKPVIHKDVRVINESEYVYFVKNSESMISDAICLFGIYDGEVLAGVCGINSIGAIDYLYICPEYRRKGYAKSIEGYVINLLLSQTNTPFLHVNETNIEMNELQKSLKLYYSDKAIFKVFK